ncbi:OprD family porin [Acinetobacter towneri]|uniref:OprD family outer membrane porin n=1 Tax=Acinetobacter towneri TaxID=202956 RepID=UPI002DBC3727|nr:OprD family outer membrane porin [Acinetobacter towneri]MEB6565388.1 OprD family porin [Acinetobacter towneri]
MLKSKKLTLALLINAALISTAFASEQSESKGFVEDANGSVLFRTGFLHRDKKDGLTNDTSSAAQTAIVKLDSGFTKGVIGFGAGIIGDASFKLGENAHTGNGMIPTHNDGSAYDHWARGGAYVKARISNTTATYGTQVLDLPVLASNTARLVPEYFTGVLVQSNEIDNLNLVAGKFTENQYSSQINSDGNELDRAVVWGAKYTFNDDLKASYYGVDVKDKLDRHYANVNYNYGLKDDAALNFDLSGYHTKFSKDASTYSATGTTANPDYGVPEKEKNTVAGTEKTNDIWAISTSYSKDVHNVMLAYQQNFGDVGYDYGGNADGAQSIYVPNSYLSDFVGNDEKSLGLQYNYNFKNQGLPGLNWTTAFVYGWDIDVRNEAKDGQEREFFNQVKYTVQSGFAKDASLRLRHSYYRANDEYKSVYMPDTNEWRIWLDIPVKLF